MKWINNKRNWIVITSFLIIIACLINLFFMLNEIKGVEKRKFQSSSYTDSGVSAEENSGVHVGKFGKGLVMEEFQPKTVTEVENGHYFIEFAQTYFGTIKLSFSEPISNDCDIEVILGEKRANDKVWSLADGGIKGGEGINYYKKIVHLYKGERTILVELPSRIRPKEGELPNGIKGIMPFRYCEIVNFNGSITKDNIKQVAVHYPFNDHTSMFYSNNTILNDIWQLSKQTIKATSYAGLYVDGNRERIPYEADAYINQLGHYSVDNEYGLARDTLLYLLKHPTWPTEWIVHAIFMANADYMYTGDIAFLRSIYPELKKRTLEPLERADGLIDTTKNQNKDYLASIQAKAPLKDIVDWPENERDHYAVVPVNTRDYIKATMRYGKLLLKSKMASLFGYPYAESAFSQEADDVAESRYNLIPVNTVVNAFHYRALYLMNKIALALGETDDAEQYKQSAESLKLAIQQKLFDYKKGLFVDGEGSEHSSLHANMFALDFDLVPEGYQENVISFIKSKGMACSVYGSQYLLEGLYSNGEAEYATSLLANTSARGWAHMMYDVGSTLTLEAWDNEVKPNQDWNHAWGTAPANIIPRWLMGIRPLEPGYKRCVIQPQVQLLSFATITTPTVHGAIKVDFRKDQVSNKIILDVETPNEVHAQIYIPNQQLQIREAFLDKVKTNVIIEDGGKIFIGEVSGRHKIEIFLE